MITSSGEYIDGLQPLIERCFAEGGLTVATLLELRSALGFGRLGKWVLAAISEALEENELGYFPTWILTPEINEEPRQTQEVWIYRQDNSPTARVISAVLAPEDAEVVRSTLVAVRLDNEANLTAEQKIERIRAIVAS